LFSDFPDQLDFGLGLVTVLVEAGKYKEAFDELDTLRNLPPPMRDDPRLDLYEAKVADFSNDFKRDESAAARAVEKARARGTKLLLARGLDQQCRAFRDLGQFKQANQACENAENLFAVAGDRNAVAMVLLTWGMVFYYQGDYDNAMQRNDEALSVFHDVGNIRGVSAAINFKASLLSEQGDLLGALDAYHQALSTAREVGSRVNVAIVQLNTADVLQEKGDLEAAKSMYAEAGVTLHELGVKNGHPLIGTAQVLLQEGELAKAKEILVTEALPMIQRTGNKSFLGEAYLALGEVFAAQGNLPQARENYQQAISVAKAMEAKTTMALYQVSLAQEMVQQGQATEAITIAKQAQDEFQHGGNVNYQLRSAGILAQALLAAGSIGEAKTTVSRARPLLPKIQSPAARLQYQIAEGEVLTAAGQPNKTIDMLRPAIAEAGKLRLVNLQFRARLAFGRALLHLGQTSAAQVQLRELEKDAKAKGFLFITHEIEGTLGPAPPKVRSGT